MKLNDKVNIKAWQIITLMYVCILSFNTILMFTTGILYYILCFIFGIVLAGVIIIINKFNNK